MEDRYGFGDLPETINWRNDWEDIISTDKQYDGDFLIRLVVHKLKLMELYFKGVYEKYCNKEFKTDNNLKEILKSLHTCVELGENILTFDYGADADKLFEEKGNINWLVEKLDSDDYIKWSELSNESSIKRQKDIEKLFKLIGKNVDSWWV